MATLAQAVPIVLDTSGSTGNSTGTGQPFGNFGTTDQLRRATLGEIFTAPVGAATFQSIAFDIRSVGAQVTQTVDAYFAVWDTGSGRPTTILGTVTGLTISDSLSFSRLAANFGSIAVVAGQRYVAYLTTLTPTGQYAGANPYEFDAGPTPGQFGGELVINLGTTFADLGPGPNLWNAPFGRPLSFVATFETPAVPEICTGGAALPLCWVALALVAAGRRGEA